VLLISPDTTTKEGASSFAPLPRAGIGNACAVGWITLLHNKSNGSGSIASHPCKKRKDGAPSVGMMHIEIVKGGPPRPKNFSEILPMYLIPEGAPGKKKSPTPFCAVGDCP
jgi:hypothetical protein